MTCARGSSSTAPRRSLREGLAIISTAQLARGSSADLSLMARTAICATAHKRFCFCFNYRCRADIVGAHLQVVRAAAVPHRAGALVL